VRTILREANLDLLGEIERLLAALVSITVVPELAAYRDQVARACVDLQGQIHRNLRDLELGRDDILPGILSETQRLAFGLQLYNQRLAGPALRGLESDRLSLRVIGWLHATHKETSQVPAAVSTEEFGIWPKPPHPVVYFMPPSAQYGLLYQPLFFHEFGHLLYACHEPEMVSLVRGLQSQIADLLEPVARRNDAQSEAEMVQRAVIVHTWYGWIQELFCDAAGLVIGGPAFLRAFNRYLRIGRREGYHCSPDQLALRPHPVTWLRVHLLARRARELGFETIADDVEQQWATIAATLGLVEDYYGFYEQEFLPAIWRTLEDMLTEAEPYRSAPHDSGEEEWTADSTPVHLANRAWHLFQNDPSAYAAWERQAIAAFLNIPWINVGTTQ
jgi:hypothetical protein